MKSIIAVSNITATAAPANNTNKRVTFKKCAPFTNCIIEIYTTQVDDTQHIDIVIPIYDLIEYSDAYSKTS